MTSILSRTTYTSLRDSVKISEMSDFFIRFKGLIRIIMIVSLVVSITSFAISLTKLSASAGNDQLRTKAMKGLLFSGLGIALFGGATVVMGFAFGLFK